MRMNSEQFKIDCILKTSPQKYRHNHDLSNRNNKYPVKKDNGAQYVQYGRNSSSPFPIFKKTQNQNIQKCIDLRQKIITSKQCLSRPTTLKQKQCQFFTQKCLSMLSRKKKTIMNCKNKPKIHDMMNNVVEKYKQKAINNRKQAIQIKIATQLNSRQPTTRAYQLTTGYEDKIEVYRMLRSSQQPRQLNTLVKREQLQWKQTPDVTGVRMNKFLKTQQPHNIQGVECFSLPISDPAPNSTKRYSMISTQVGLIQRSLSQHSSRRKISISKAPTNKFMAFSKNDPDAHYMKKLKSFLDFIFKINFSNKIYVSLALCDDTNNISKYKVFIGRGNNSLLIKSLLKRRFWIEIVDNQQQEGINFFWTQNKVDRIHYKQKLSKRFRIIDDKQFSEAKKSNFKTQEQKQIIELNKKILTIDETAKVEKFILKNGYYAPFDETYTCQLITNHLPRNNCIGSKKNLFKSLHNYYRDFRKTDPFQYIPKTYSIKNSQDPQFKRFLKDYENNPDKVWIVKPGENSNRGNGIKLAETRKVIDLVRKKQKHSNGQLKTYILQSYIEKPFLYNNRKFDIRHYMLLTSVNGILKAYWYKQGYLRTSSQKFDIDDLDNEVVHLTNDAIQQKDQAYEKYQPGNKLSYTDFQRYLDMTYPAKGYNFQKDIVPGMKQIILDVIKANYNTLDRNRRECNFEIFGFDFMIDKQFKPWLIEINFNPCLQINCPLLSRIIPVMVQSSLRVGLDPLMPPKNHYSANKRYSLSDNYLKNLRYQLIFDESTFPQSIPILYEIDDSDDQQQQYCDDGKQVQDLII